MKPAPAQNVLGNTKSERFENAICTIFRVSKETLLKSEAKLKTMNRRMRAKAKKPA